MNYLFNVFMSMIPYLIGFVFLIIMSLVPLGSIAKSHPVHAARFPKMVRAAAVILLMAGLLMAATSKDNTPKNEVANARALAQQQIELSNARGEKASNMEMKDIMRPRTRTPEKLKQDHDAAVDYRK